jgi:serine/threonine kinase 16
MSPFEYALNEQGGSLHLAAISGVVKWPPGPHPPYPEALHKFVTWMLTPSPGSRPYIQDVCLHVDKLITESKFDTDAQGLWPLKA